MEQLKKQDFETIETSQDQFFRGKFYAIQPVGTGHRSGSDALLIAASLPNNASGQLVDLGSGTGVAGLAALHQNPNLEALLVEKNSMMFDLANRTLRLPENAKLSRRAKIIQADATLTGDDRIAQGLEDNFADFVIANPPYNYEGQRVSPDIMKAEAHVMGAKGLDSWVRTSAAILKPGGTLILIYRVEKLGEIIACSQGRFGDLSVVPVHARVGEQAKRLIVRLVKGSRAPLSIMPGIVMHDEEGAPTELNQLLMNGNARIEFSQ